jgi:general stress protein 26
MSISKSAVLDFLREHRYAVQASVNADGGPQAALVGVVVNDRFEFFFDSFNSTRKVANLRGDPRVALVVGGHTIGDERTVQIEGTLDQPSGSELLEFQKQYFAILPDGRRRSKLPGITYFRVRPQWLRYSDFNVTPPLIVEFAAAALSGD